MCGSGTFLCEAAMMALDKAPGLERSFALQKLNTHDESAWARLRQSARERVRSVSALPIFGSDRYGEFLELARANLRALGVDRLVKLKQADILEMPAPARSGMLVTNPPYGVRLDDQEVLAALYPRLGDALKKKYAGWISLHLHCGSAASEAHRPRRFAAHAALQRRARMPALRVQARCRQHAAEGTKGESGVKECMRVKVCTSAPSQE